jgi:hypothetical protein
LGAAARIAEVRQKRKTHNGFMAENLLAESTAVNGAADILSAKWEGRDALGISRGWLEGGVLLHCAC